MPDVAGTIVRNAPILTVRVSIGDIVLSARPMLVNSGAAHILVAYPAARATPELSAAYASWPEEMFFGVGSLYVRRAPSGVLHLTDVNGRPLEIPVQPVHVLLYEPDDTGFAPFSIP